MDYSLKINDKIINKISCNSSEADSKTIFFCLLGARSDGHNYAQDAYAHGCRVFCVSKDIPLPGDCTIIKVENTRRAMAEYSCKLYNYPSERIKIIGITGTKGKSSVGTIIYNILNSVNKKAAFIGTTGVDIGNNHYDSLNTTPESNLLNKYLSEAIDEGCEYAVMEVSSQATKQHRTDGIVFEISAFTNLSNDHIGPTEHKDYSEYRECKGKLFTQSKISVLNIDDKEYEYFKNKSIGKTASYSIYNPSDFKAENIKIEKEKFGISYSVKDKSYCLNTIGMFNVYNSLCASLVLKMLGLKEDIISAKLNSVRTAKGRLEKIDLSEYGINDINFIIDYAHNGVSLNETLKVLRNYTSGRLICLFGAIGGRAQHRRKELAQACINNADFGIITTDNPDFEDPKIITQEIDSYMGNFPRIIINDRKEAIEYAFNISSPGDIVLLAGKGHENYQIVRGKKEYFCESEILIDIAKSQNNHINMI